MSITTKADDKYEIKVVATKISQEQLDAIREDYGHRRNFAGKGDFAKHLHELAEAAVADFKAVIKIFPTIHIVYVKRMEEMGRYREGTESAPIILLNPLKLWDAADDRDIPLDIVVSTTIYHELGHAICDLATASNVDYDDGGDEEDFVEKFANYLYEHKKVPKNFQDILKKI